MASLVLQLRSHHQIKSSPILSFSHLFSSSSGNNNGGNSSSYFSDVKFRLKQQEQQQNQPMGPSIPRKASSLNDVQKRISEFRIRSSIPAPESSPANSQQPTLLQDIYKRNMAMSNPNPSPNGENSKKGILSFESIKNSLRGLRKTPQGENGSNSGSDHLSLSRYKDSFRLSSPMVDNGRKVVHGGGGTEGLPISVFGREINEREKKKDSVEDEMAKSELIRMYTHAELGEKLKELRPEAKKGGKESGFSFSDSFERLEKESGFLFSELNERLEKVRVNEEQQSLARTSGPLFRDLRSRLKEIQLSEYKSKPQCDSQEVCRSKRVMSVMEKIRLARKRESSSIPAPAKIAESSSKDAASEGSAKIVIDIPQKKRKVVGMPDLRSIRPFVDAGSVEQGTLFVRDHSDSLGESAKSFDAVSLAMHSVVEQHKNLGCVVMVAQKVLDLQNELTKAKEDLEKQEQVSKDLEEALNMERHRNEDEYDRLSRNYERLKKSLAELDTESFNIASFYNAVGRIH